MDPRSTTTPPVTPIILPGQGRFAKNLARLNALQKEGNPDPLKTLTMENNEKRYQKDIANLATRMIGYQSQVNGTTIDPNHPDTASITEETHRLFSQKWDPSQYPLGERYQAYQRIYLEFTEELEKEILKKLPPSSPTSIAIEDSESPSQHNEYNMATQFLFNLGDMHELQGDASALCVEFSSLAQWQKDIDRATDAHANAPKGSPERKEFKKELSKLNEGQPGEVEQFTTRFLRYAEKHKGTLTSSELLDFMQGALQEKAEKLFRGYKKSAQEQIEPLLEEIQRIDPPRASEDSPLTDEEKKAIQKEREPLEAQFAEINQKTDDEKKKIYQPLEAFKALKGTILKKVEQHEKLSASSPGNSPKTPKRWSLSLKSLFSGKSEEIRTDRNKKSPLDTP